MRGMASGVTGKGVPWVRMGDDASLVVIHGGQGFVRQASPERLARDARRVAKIVPAGRSFLLIGYDPAPAADLSIDEVVAATIEAIAEVAPRAEIDLAGISYGGMIACRVAAARAGLVRRLVLVASGHRFSAGGAEHVRGQVALLEAGDLGGFTRAFTGLFRRRWLNWLIGLAIRRGRRRIEEGMAPAPAIVRYLRAMLAAAPADLSAIGAPALVIGGSADQFFGEGVMEEMAAALPSATLLLLPGETHMAPIEAARKFERAIGAFLAPG